jgi:uncharacterized protein YccT (UPF0319 family)
MRKAPPALLLLLALVPVPATVAADPALIELPEEVVLQAVNGEPHRTGLFGAREPLRLAPGRHRIAFRYRDLFEFGGDSHEVVTSPLLILDFELETADGYRLDFDRPRDVEAGRRFARRPAFTLVDGRGSPVPRQSLSAEASEPLLARALGFGGGASAARLTDPEATAARSAPVPASESTATHPAATAANPDQRMAAEQLRYWWSLADAETRAAFLRELEVRR